MLGGRSGAPVNGIDIPQSTKAENSNILRHSKRENILYVVSNWQFMHPLLEKVR